MEEYIRQLHLKIKRIECATTTEGTPTGSRRKRCLAGTQDTIIDESRECDECHVLKEDSRFDRGSNTCSDCQRSPPKRQRKASNRVLQQKATEEELTQLKTSARSKKQANQNRKQKVKDARKQLQAKRTEALP